MTAQAVLERSAPVAGLVTPSFAPVGRLAWVETRDRRAAVVAAGPSHALALPDEFSRRVPAGAHAGHRSTGSRDGLAHRPVGIWVPRAAPAEVLATGPAG